MAYLKGAKGISDIHAVVAVGQTFDFFGGYDPPKKWNRFMDQIHVHVFNTVAFLLDVAHSDDWKSSLVALPISTQLC